MKKSQITAIFQADIKTVWQVVTDHRDVSWRQGIDRVEVSPDGKRFTEYTEKGQATEFTITKVEPYSLYSFSMDHKFFSGFWFGTFSETPEGGTKVVFTENIEMKTQWLKMLFTIFMNLPKMQQQYVDDLRKKLGEA